MLCKHGLCCHAVSVCLSVTFLNSVKTSNRIFFTVKNSETMPVYCIIFTCIYIYIIVSIIHYYRHLVVTGCKVCNLLRSKLCSWPEIGPYLARTHKYFLMIAQMVQEFLRWWTSKQTHTHRHCWKNTTFATLSLHEYFYVCLCMCSQMARPIVTKLGTQIPLDLG